MNIAKNIKPISYVKAHTAEVFRQVAGKNAPVIITQNGEAKAVLLDVNYYQKLKELLNMLKLLAIGESDLRNKRIVHSEELDKKIRDLLE